MEIAQAPNDYFAPDDVGAIYPEVARSLRFDRAARPAGEYSLRFDLLRRKTEGMMLLREQSLKRSSQFRPRKSLVLASA